jgi:hypothetical protein
MKLIVFLCVFVLLCIHIHSLCPGTLFPKTLGGTGGDTFFESFDVRNDEIAFLGSSSDPITTLTTTASVIGIMLIS